MTVERSLASRLRDARAVTVLSGAGMSAESGIPTFRSGVDALWRGRRPETLATPNAFAHDPLLVWRWYGERLAHLRACRPNPGHTALVRIAALVPHLTIVTQNVDGLHRAAGSTRVIELHGDIRRARCTACGMRRTDHVDAAIAGTIPRCVCGAMLRPDVVWFGEMLPDGAIEEASAAAAGADVFFVAGTSAVVYPAAGLVPIAREAGAFVVEVNPEPTDASSLCDLIVRTPAGVLLPQHAAELEALVARDQAG